MNAAGRAPAIAAIAAVALHSTTPPAALASDQPQLPEGLAAIGVHLESRHSEPGRNDRNRGLYIRTSSGLLVGGYRNSEGGDSAYIGQVLASTNPSRTLVGSIAAGGVTGYSAGPLLPFATFNGSVKLGDRASLNLSYMPKVRPHRGSHVLHLSAEWRLQ